MLQRNSIGVKGMARSKKQKKQSGKALERVYLILTLVAVAGVAVFLGYVVGQYAIQAATSALDRELVLEGEKVRQQVAEKARQEAPEPSLDIQRSTAVSEEPKTPEPITARPQPVVESPSIPLPQAVPTRSSKQLYRVQVGAFSSEANAERLAQELERKGYQVLVTPGSLHRVQVGAFAERGNAEALKQELEDKGYPAAIISTE